MAVAFRSLTQGTGTAASCGRALPASFAANDYLLYLLYKENTNAVTWPGSFSQSATVTATGSSFALYFALLKATGGESGTQTASWTGSVYWESALLAYSGADTTTGQDATATTAANGSLGNTSTAPTITTVTANAMLVAFTANFGSGSTTWGAPSGMTLRTSGQTDTGIADVLQASAGASGVKTFTCNGTGQSAGIMIALRPAGVVVLPTLNEIPNILARW